MGLTEDIEKAHLRLGVLPPRNPNQEHIITLQNTSEFMQLVYNVYGPVAKNNLNLGYGINYHAKSFALKINEQKVVEIICPIRKTKLEGEKWLALYQEVQKEALKIKYGPEIMDGFNPLPFVMTFNDYKIARDRKRNFII